MNVERIVGLAVEGQLLTAEQAAEKQQAFLANGGNATDGTGFIRSLIEQHLLTEFQGRALLAGIAGPYMLGPYKVTGRIAAGRLGDVFHAEHVEFQQPVSLKVFPTTLSKSRERLARLGREARVALQVNDLHVVKTYQVGKAGDVSFIALEELVGETLEQKLSREVRLPYADACQLIYQAAQGLQYLHSEGIIHRDICPANLWVSAHGLVKIMEFGAARDAMAFLDSLDSEDEGELTVASNGMTDPASVLGRYDYMSPEQAQDPHNANEASDLYSLGCTLYHCLTGQVPFPDKNPVRQMLRHANEAPKLLSDFDPEIPEAVQEIVSKLLAKNPKDRYESAEDVATDLANIVPPKALPELDPVNAEFLQWLQTNQDAADITEYEPEFQDFLSFVSDSYFGDVMTTR